MYTILKIPYKLRPDQYESAPIIAFHQGILSSTRRVALSNIAGAIRNLRKHPDDRAKGIRAFGTCTQCTGHEGIAAELKAAVAEQKATVRYLVTGDAIASGGAKPIVDMDAEGRPEFECRIVPQGVEITNMFGILDEDHPALSYFSRQISRRAGNGLRLAGYLAVAEYEEDFERVWKLTSERCFRGQ